MDTNRFLIFYQSFDTVVKGIKKKEMSYMREYGLRSVHMGCLIRIEQSKNGITISQIARESKTDKALISRVIKELAADEFVETKTAGEDKSYNKKYYLTEKGKQVTADINEDIGLYMTRAREGVSDEDMQKFYEILAVLTKNISLIADSEE